MATVKLRKKAQDVEPSPLRMTYQEFLEWANEDVHAEWVNGEVIVQMPPKDRHQDVVRFLAVLLDLFIAFFNLGKLRFAPFEMKLTDGPAREPDILFLANEHLDRLTEDRLQGPADLIIEVLSDDSIRRDRVEKFREYESAGVAEYWIIDSRPGRQRADFFRLGDDGRYELFATEDDERVHSNVVPDFWIRPAWLWQEPLPDTLTVLAEIRGLSAETAAMLRQVFLTGQAPET
jgi:Uma2 family endonuclease